MTKKFNIQPQNTYNMDEKGFMMGVAKRCKVICKKRRRNPRLTHDGSRVWVTVIEAISGDGRTLPPMIINKGDGHYMGWYAALKDSDKAVFGYSPKGWSDQKLGFEWLVKDFEPNSAKQ